MEERSSIEKYIIPTTRNISILICGKQASIGSTPQKVFFFLNIKVCLYTYYDLTRMHFFCVLEFNQRICLD